MSTSPQKNNLGRGLAALFGDDGPQASLEEQPAVGREVPIEHVHRNPNQPRQKFDDDKVKELADSIRANGILQPILVRKHPDHQGQFQIVAGERRWRAAQLAKLHKIPVVIRQLGDAQMLELGLVENLQREDLSIMEEAESYHKLITEFGNTQDSLARVLGKSRSYVANTLRLLGLPPAIRKLLEEEQMSAGHARALLGAKDPVEIAERVVEQKLNVRQTERLVKDERKRPEPADAESSADSGTTPATTLGSSGAATGGAKAPSKDKDSDTIALEKDLSDRLGLRVNINFTDPGGTVAIRYESLEQLDDLVQRLESVAARRPATAPTSQSTSQSAKPSVTPAPGQTPSPKPPEATKPNIASPTSGAEKSTAPPAASNMASKPAQSPASAPQTPAKPVGDANALQAKLAQTSPAALGAKPAPNASQAPAAPSRYPQQTQKRPA